MTKDETFKQLMQVYDDNAYYWKQAGIKRIDWIKWQDIFQKYSDVRTAYRYMTHKDLFEIIAKTKTLWYTMSSQAWEYLMVADRRAPEVIQLRGYLNELRKYWKGRPKLRKGSE